MVQLQEKGENTVKFNTIREIKRHNADNGYFFFERDTMRFFRSRIAPGVYHAEGNANLFITSEQFSSDALRRYTIRQIADDGDIHTVGEFQHYPTLRAARRAIKTGEAFID